MAVPRTSATAMALLICGALASGHQESGQQPVFRSGVELVSVDVTVLDRHGDPLRGLTPADFKVTVDGRLRPVVSAEFVDVAAARASRESRPERADVSTNQGAGVGRQIIFVVDQGTLETGTARYVARAAQAFFKSLSFEDRTGLVMLPIGKNVNLTWSHDQVHAALQRLAGTNASIANWEYGSLSEARDIASRNFSTLEIVSQRECGTSLAGRGGGAVGGGGAAGGGGTGGGSTTPPGEGRGGGSGGAAGGSSATPTGIGGGGMSTCMRNIQVMAESTWRVAQMTSLASLASLRQVFDTLAQVPGDKTVILLSGGWPLDQHDEVSALKPLVDAAAAARVTLFPLFVPRSRFSASQSSMSPTPTQDQSIQAGPLQHLAGLSGGEFLRAEVSAEAAFDRLARQLSGFYRLGVERTAEDTDGKSRRLDVDVSRGGTTVRTRELFDVRTFEDRNWTARLASALDSPVPAAGIPLRLTSYVALDPEDRTRLTLMLAGAATRTQAGDATLQVVVRDTDGRKVLSGEPPVSHATAEGLEFAMNVPVPPGSYVVRVGVMDSAGHVGSVEHRVDVRRTAVGGMTAAGPVLVRVPGKAGGEPRIALGAAAQDERLALEIALEGDSELAAQAAVVFEIAGTLDGPVLIHAPATLSRAASEGAYMAQALADLRVLPPGDYVARAKVTSGGTPAGELRRWFTVTGVAIGSPAPASGAAASPAAGPAASPVPLSARSVGAVRPFALDHVLAPSVLGGFLERVAARPDAASPMIRELVERARKDGIEQVPVSDTLAAQSPVAAFLRGLKFFAARDYPAAATAFRASMRAAPDMFPAMVYLGACYAAGGKDKEAAGAWQTALIRAGDEIALHRLLADAHLRMGSGERALQAVERAQVRWPGDQELSHQFVVAAILGGKRAEGLDALDRLFDKGDTVEEPTLALAILVLYEGFEQKRPVESAEADRARMIRLAERYRARGGPSLALVDAWVAAVK